MVLLVTVVIIVRGGARGSGSSLIGQFLEDISVCSTSGLVVERFFSSCHVVLEYSRHLLSVTEIYDQNWSERSGCDQRSKLR